MLNRTNLIVGYILFSIGFFWGGNCVHFYSQVKEKNKLQGGMSDKDKLYSRNFVLLAWVV